MPIPAEDLMALWRGHGSADDLLAVGVLQSALYCPVKPIADSDYVVLQSVGYAVCATLAKVINDTNLPDEVISMIANSLLGVYGLGKRRGAAKVDDCGATRPYKSRLTLLPIQDLTPQESTPQEAVQTEIHDKTVVS